jgi:ABC-2 type transport system ATP-binding protein
MTWGVEDLTVLFGGTTALEGVDLVAERGTAVAAVGGDGAGKTTLLRVLAGLPVSYRGHVRIPEARRIGYVPAGTGVFRDLTAAENLDFTGRAYGLADPVRRAEPLLERTGLAPFTDRLAGNLSGGMRRKLAVVAAMLHEPDLLVLDEPTTGIDPVSRADLWRLIAAAAGGGAAVVLSSAYLDEAERASAVLVLHEGAPVVWGTPEEVAASLPGAVIDTARPSDPARAWRRGAIWREWLPEGGPGAIPPALEDVVIVAALREREVAR